jgi:UDP:flavonoid glycosyltransferase YjiC (YdhE family)
LVQLGLGCAVRNDAAAGAVGKAVGRLLSDDELRAAVRSMGDEIAAMPSPAAVVEKLVHRYG